MMSWIDELEIITTFQNQLNNKCFSALVLPSTTLSSKLQTSAGNAITRILQLLN